MIADREVTPAAGDPQVIFCADEFGLNLQPRPGRQWAAIGGNGKEPGRAPRPQLRATCTRTAGVRYLFAAYELGEDKLFGHIKPRKTRARFLEFCRYLRSLYPPPVRMAIICDNFSPHLSTAAALRNFALDGTDHAGHTEQATMIRRYIIWRNNHAYDERLRGIVNRANVA